MKLAIRWMVSGLVFGIVMSGAVWSLGLEPNWRLVAFSLAVLLATEFAELVGFLVAAIQRRAWP